MKTPIKMLETVATEIIENTSLLEVIYRINELPPEADNAIACLIRSMQKALDGVNEYVTSFTSSSVNVKTGVSNNDSANTSRELTGDVLDSWAGDIGNCKMSLCNAMDCIPQDLHAIGTLTIVFEKLDDLQETISKKAKN
ncbi:TPA: hypothetical protein MND73_000805 [Salmonella enterica subsp. houtenae]|nr:hypothetical protein [Salmonella enterica subsp. houtenae]